MRTDRAGLLIVAGGATGRVFVYDTPHPGPAA
ncbi:hypothetical protein M2163_001459 [Streptomyces sp. SAI-135]|nr:hypothetical protein [Streptomyces sp. SAI-090]MDH6553841.1 hypothetical protein [Streptomyces sp. SAI-041]MDH6572919.1 hypothetical protein [Streptomyces sp. SAI-117]MDH6582119.1 hypothetical protein [Streptomyces sp. SAI-133]MDH6614351.1 hypothetical protein [Streptomyces sp. SAI-135]